MSCVSILSELIVVGGFIALGFMLYGMSNDIKPNPTDVSPKLKDVDRF